MKRPAVTPSFKRPMRLGTDDVGRRRSAASVPMVGGGTMTPPDPGTVWLLVVALGAGSFELRLSFVQLHRWLGEFPPRVERRLDFVPAAVLAALVSVALFVPDGPVVARPVATLVDARVLAAGLAGVVAWRTGSTLATIGVSAWPSSGPSGSCSGDSAHLVPRQSDALPSLRTVRPIRVRVTGGAGPAGSPPPATARTPPRSSR